MSGTASYNGQIPTDPAQFAGLLLAAVTLVSQLSPDQVDAVKSILELALVALPFVPGGRR